MIDTSEPLLWFVGRAAGLTSLVALTLSVVLGIAAGARSPALPRFVTQGLHRSSALAGVLLLLVHVGAVVADPFVPLEWSDIWLPFNAGYRPLWTGLGTLAVDVLLVVLVTSMLRRRLSPRGWWWVHISAYAAYGMSVAHGLGAGTDAGEPLVAALTAGSVGSVLAALVLRLRRARSGGTRYDAACERREGATGDHVHS